MCIRDSLQGRREKNAGLKWTEDRKKRQRKDERILEKKKRARNKEFKLGCGPQMADKKRKKDEFLCIKRVRLRF